MTEIHPFDHDDARFALSRRGALQSGVLMLGWLALPAAARAAASAPDAGALLARVGDILIPTTETGGAGAPAVIDFVLVAARSGMRGAPVDLLQRLAGELDSRSGGSFLSLSRPQQASILATIDHAAYTAATPTGSAWPMTKTLLLMGYYTSEEGASKELAYELVPGRFDNDIPVHPGDKALSNDWSGVTIRKAGPN